MEKAQCKFRKNIRMSQPHPRKNIGMSWPNPAQSKGVEKNGIDACPTPDW